MRLPFAILLLFRCLLSPGQDLMQGAEWPYTYRHYSDEDGLPQNSVKAIVADQSGFIWFATENGLVRFDGLRFRTYDKSNTPLSYTRFYSIQPDLSGDAGKYYAIAELKEFVKIENATARVDGDYFKTYFSLVPHVSERMDKTFLATGAPNYWLDLSVPKSYIMLSPLGKGAFFIVRKDSVSFYSNFGKTGTLACRTGELKNYFIEEGSLYRYNAKGQILQLTPAGLRSMKLEGDILRDQSLGTPSGKFRFFWNNPADQSFMLLNNNLYFLEKQRGNTFRTRLILNGFDFDAKDIRSVYYDPVHRRVFLGSVTSGLHVFSRKQFTPLQVGNKDMDNVFYGQVAFDSNRVLTPLGVIMGLSADGKRIQSEIERPKNAILSERLRQDGRSMLRDVHGNIWSKAFNHVYLYDRDGKTMIAKWRADDQIKSVFEDVDNGRVWLGVGPLGLHYIRYGQKQLTRLEMKPLPEIAYLAKAGKSKLWVATVAGLYLADIRSRTARLIPGTGKVNVRSVLPDKADPETVFFTTYEDGIFLYKNGKLTPFPMDAKRNLASAHCIVEDKKGFFWIPTNNGLFQMAKADLLAFSEKWRAGRDMPQLFYMYYSREDGFLTNEFNGGCQPCAVQLPNGAVSLPSLNGLVWFWPDRFFPEIPSGPLVLDGLFVRGKLLPVNDGRVELPVNPRQIAVRLAVPFFGNQNNIHLSYALVRKGKVPEINDWVALNAADPVIRFPDLDYGNYVLLVKKNNGFGIDHFSEVHIDLVIPPDWYESWWLKMIAVILLAACVYAYILFRVSFLQRRNNELEAKVERRTNRLQQALAALQISEKELNRQMHIQSRLIASISHDVRTPLRFIIASAERIAGFTKEQRGEMVIKLSENIAASGEQMARFLDNTMAYIKTQVYEKQIHLEPVALLPLIQEKADFFGAQMKEHGTKLVNQVDAAVTVRSNAQLLGTIIHNVLDNAAKYTFDGIITITTEVQQKSLHLIIADTGPGIPEDLIYWLNSGNVKDSPEPVTSISGGYNSLGMLIVREIAGMINTAVHIENDNGTRVHIVFQPGAEPQ